MASAKVNASMRVFLFVFFIVLAVGIWLTGYKTVHWLLYIPTGFALFAAITGICPGMFFSRLITGNK